MLTDSFDLRELIPEKLIIFNLKHIGKSVQVKDNCVICPYVSICM